MPHSHRFWGVTLGLSALLAAGPLVPAEAQIAKLSVGGVDTELTVTHCRTEAYEAGASPGLLRIEAEITARGTFRGRPAALFLAKATNADFENIDLYLTELSAEEQAMPPLPASTHVRNAHGLEWGQREVALTQEYNFEEMVEAGLEMEEIFAKQDELSQRIRELRREGELALPWARVFGAITLDGTSIEFVGGHQTSLNPNEGVPAFDGLEGDVRLVAECR